MEALKNTSMMLILAAVFYGAYQMFVSDPNSWKQASDQQPQEQLIFAGQNAAANPSTSTASTGTAPTEVIVPPGITSSHQARLQQQNQLQQNQFAGNLAAGSGQLPSANGPFQAGVANPAQPSQQGFASLPPTANRIANQPNSVGGTLQSDPRAGSMNSGIPTATLPNTRANTLPNTLPQNQNNSNEGNSNQGMMNAGLSLPQPGNNFATPQSPDNLYVNSTQPNQGDLNSVQTVGYVDGNQNRDGLIPIQRNSASVDPATTLNGINPAIDIAQNNQGLGASNQTAPSSDQTAALAADMQAATTEIQTGRLGSALQRLSAWYNRPLAAADRSTLISWLDNLAGEVVYSTKHALTDAYIVQAGDTLGSIATQYNVSPQLLANINYYGQNVQSNDPLQPGSELKVVPGPLHAVANLSTKELTVFVGPLYAGRFMFRTGDSAPTDELSNAISHISNDGIPAQDMQQKHAPLSQGNPFGRYCLVVGDEVVLHSPGNNPTGSCLEFQEADMQNLMVLLNKGCHVQVVR